MKSSSDFIRVNDLALTVSFADGSRWPANPPHPQPVVVSFSFAHDVRTAAATDDLAHSVNYSTLAKGMQAVVGTEVFPSLERFADRVCDVYASQYAQVPSFTVRIRRPQALLYGAAFGIEITKPGSDARPSEEKLFFEDVVGHSLIGIHPHERQRKQRVRMARQQPMDFRTLEQKIFDCVEEATFLTVEALASEVARVVLDAVNDETAITVVRVSKPSAIINAASAEVEVSRDSFDFKVASRAASANSTDSPATPAPPPASASPSPSLYTRVDVLPHRAAIALGANIGDRFANIETALRLLEAPGADLDGWTGPPRVIVIDTSFMYETAPMYVEDQPKFINCACMVETDLEPRALLSFLKDIENAVGRTVSYRNGPRVVDLDIVSYDSIVLDTRPESARSLLDNLAGELVIPHPRVTEREFVLRPLYDMIPEYIVPLTGRSIEELLTTLMLQDTDEPAMYKVIPFPRYPLPSISERPAQLSKINPVPPTATFWTHPVTSIPSKGRPQPRRTYLMATLNVTPDSFSDGSTHNTIPTALNYATAAVTHGAHIVDIGGYSTRPNAAYVAPEEEFTRVVPVIQAIRSEGAANTDPLTPVPPGTSSPLAALRTRRAGALISVDTFRWEVAEEAVHAGANCINDISALAGPTWPALASADARAHFSKMRQVARDLAVPVVMMHSRGPAGENKDYGAYAYAAGGRGRGAVLEAVRVELGERIDAAVRGPGGLRRWLVIVDPGLGFSKTLEGNLEVLRDAASIVADRPLVAREGESEPRRNLLVGYPQLIGPSRKSFLGAVLQRADADGTGGYEGRETRADERDWATAAAVGCAVQQGAMVVRVHDVQRQADVVRVSSALWG